MKKQYFYPETRVENVNTRLMAITDVASLLPGPGYQGAPKRKKGEVQVF